MGTGKPVGEGTGTRPTTLEGLVLRPPSTRPDLGGVAPRHSRSRREGAYGASRVPPATTR